MADTPCIYWWFAELDYNWVQVDMAWHAEFSRYAQVETALSMTQQREVPILILSICISIEMKKKDYTNSICQAYKLNVVVV